MDYEKNIKTLLFDFGLPCIQKQATKSAHCITIHYNLLDVTQLNLVPKKLQYVSTFLHINLMPVKSSVAHFAVTIPLAYGGVNFYDKQFNECFKGKDYLKYEEKERLEIFAGVDMDNIPLMLQLDDLPHILIAGTTGSGKSVMLNSVICSLLRNNTFSNFYMIDTKRVELSPYKAINWHCKVANSQESAISILEDICNELDARYEIMEENCWRKIPDNYPRTIVVIEELGDLMAISKKVVEKHIVKIARLGRACGIHLIIATQRPTTDVVTGEIKANIGCRFALQTTSSIDSRNILGHSGAEKLRGKGDCLLKLPTQADEIHLQCPYISDEEIQKTIYDYVEEKK